MHVMLCDWGFMLDTTADLHFSCSFDMLTSSSGLVNHSMTLLSFLRLFLMSPLYTQLDMMTARKLLCSGCC
jgi:hypothetical protein